MSEQNESHHQTPKPGLFLGGCTKIILETQRLLLREMTQTDFPALADILQDEQTMYAYEGAFDDTETQAWLDKRLMENGFPKLDICLTVPIGAKDTQPKRR